MTSQKPSTKSQVRALDGERNLVLDDLRPFLTSPGARGSNEGQRGEVDQLLSLSDIEREVRLMGGEEREREKRTIGYSGL